ncbi:uncharacterized protein LOC133805042 isoform X2 [Humulus lupulus]|uniref:uncharacterized protein LOC133805042 isoform X2 n=1 Tax=Humulus lupulus TaxID=3486 RepID=UPI002B4052D0|nr:uncharacterized protein LOC133805042 isoform X2 [Humulus lupulus]
MNSDGAATLVLVSGEKALQLGLQVIAKIKGYDYAAQVLSDPQKRAIYDQYAEEGLKGQVPPPDAAGGFPGGGATFFQTGDGPMLDTRERSFLKNNWKRKS